MTVKVSCRWKSSKPRRSLLGAQEDTDTDATIQTQKYAGHPQILGSGVGSPPPDPCTLVNTKERRAAVLEELPSPGSTVPDSATWEYWPHAPTDDFGQFIPWNRPAQKNFQLLIARLIQGKVPGYSCRYIHDEFASNNEAAGLYNSEPESDGDMPQDIISECRPAVTGFFRLNAVDPTPRNPELAGFSVSAGWVSMSSSSSHHQATEIQRSMAATFAFSCHHTAGFQWQFLPTDVNLK